jgi:hypothetical protein
LERSKSWKEDKGLPVPVETCKYSVARIEQLWALSIRETLIKCCLKGRLKAFSAMVVSPQTLRGRLFLNEKAMYGHTTRHFGSMLPARKSAPTQIAFTQSSCSTAQIIYELICEEF